MERCLQPDIGSDGHLLSGSVERYYTSLLVKSSSDIWVFLLDTS